MAMTKVVRTLCNLCTISLAFLCAACSSAGGTAPIATATHVPTVLATPTTGVKILSTPILTYSGHQYLGVIDAEWSPDGKRIASATGNINYEQGPESVQIWDATTGQTLMNYTVESVDGFADGVFSVSWSPDGTRLAIAGADFTADIVDVATGQLLLIYHGHTKVVWSVAWSPDGKYIVSGGQDTTAQVWVP